MSPEILAPDVPCNSQESVKAPALEEPVRTSQQKLQLLNGAIEHYRGSPALGMVAVVARLERHRDDLLNGEEGNGSTSREEMFKALALAEYHRHKVERLEREIMQHERHIERALSEIRRLNIVKRSRQRAREKFQEGSRFCFRR